MSIPRIPLLLISLSFAAVPLAAQSSIGLDLLAASPLDNPFRDAPVDPFKLQMNAPESTSGNPFFLLSPDTKTYVVRGPDVDAQSDVTCLSIRTYRVKRDNPHSDATSPAGSSICTPSQRFQVRSAVDVSGAKVR